MSYRSLWFGNTDLGNLNNTLQFNEYTGPKGDKSEWTTSASFDGSSKTFKELAPSGSENWVLLRSTGASLVLNGSNHVVTLQDGEVRTYGDPTGFNSFQMLVSRVQPNGVTWTYQWQGGTYLGQGRPISVTNNLGYRISLEYLSDTSTNIDDWSFVKTVKFYNLAVSTTVPVSTASRTRIPNGVQVVTAGGQVWNVSGSTAPLSTDTYISSAPFQVKTPSSTATNLTYTAVRLKVAALPTYNFHVTTSAVKNGLTTNYDFSMASVSGSNIGTTKVTDPLGKITEVQYTDYTAPLAQAAFPFKITNPLGNITQYSTNGYIITSVMRPDGDQDVYGYDSRGNLNLITHKAKPGGYGRVGILCCNLHKHNRLQSAGIRHRSHRQDHQLHLRSPARRRADRDAAARFIGYPPRQEIYLRATFGLDQQWRRGIRAKYAIGMVEVRRADLPDDGYRRERLRRRKC